MKFLRVTAFAAAVCMITPLTSCGKKNKTDLTPLMGLKWFENKADVMENLQYLTLIEEREKEYESAKQYYVDYEDASLLDHDCTLTVCFTEQGFVGLNYHDLNRMDTFRQWYTALEDIYGSATEQGSGIASWYENPVGKNTAIYLFNLEEGVQVSFYATGDSPDREYNKKKGEKQNYDLIIPSPEIRTPVVAVEDDVIASHSIHEINGNTEQTNIVYTNEDGILVTDVVVKDESGEVVVDEEGETVVTAVPVVTTIVTDEKGKEITTEVTDEKGKPVIETTASDKPLTTVTTTALSAKTTETTEITTTVVTKPVVIDHKKDFLQNVLSFYTSSTRARSRMSNYKQLYEYRIEEPGQPWELIMEYENVPYLNKKCDTVLCFTSLGLVGVNYYDSSLGGYNYWIQELTDIYGEPSETQYDYTAWLDNPVGSGTVVYVFDLGDEVQISFFADDTGSEIAK